MKYGHDDFGRRHAFLVNIDWNAPAVVTNANGLVNVDGDGYFGAMTSQSFVDRIIDHLEDHVVQTGAIIRVADIHAGALTYRIEALENLDTGRIVRVVVAHAFTPEGRGPGLLHHVPRETMRPAYRHASLLAIRSNRHR